MSEHADTAGQPEDCADVLEAVYLFLDNECDDVARERIRRHLDSCSPCLSEYGLEQDVKRLLARKCGGDRAPESLRLSVQLRLSQSIIDLD